MKKENLLVITLVCIAVFGGMMYYNSKSGNNSVSAPAQVFSLDQETSTIAWQDYDQGMALAKKQDKPIFLYFHADWCTYCKKLKRTTFKDAAVLTYLKDNFISIIVDADREKERTTQWKVKGLPTLWFLEPDASQISSIPGYVDKKQFLHVLKYIHTRSYDQMTLREFIKTL